MLLLLFATPADQAQTITELVQAAPVASHGYPIQRDASAGTWRLALELADPAAGLDVEWHDATEFYVGDRHQFGADQPFGDARARLVSVQLQAPDDRLAPWGLDTTDVFGADVELDAGLLMRLVMFRIDGGDTVEWAAVWTGRVESWGDASEARGQIRTHVVSVIDTMSDLMNTPTEIVSNAEPWDTVIEDEILPAANWLFGVDIYGDTGTPGILQDLNLVAAANRLDQITDPLGLVWRSLRSGRMVIHPAPWDTYNTNRYDNPLLDVYPDGLKFSYEPDLTDIEYIDDDGQQSFGIQRNIAGVLNYFVVTFPGPTLYVSDDPVSISKYQIRPFQATWILDNEQVVDDLVATRAYASSQALPLRTTLDHEGFWPAMLLVDHLDPVTIVHATSEIGEVVTATGTVRNIVEERTISGEADGTWLLTWQTTAQFDLDSTTATPALLPVEDLVLVSAFTPGFGGPSGAEFSWTNPVQPDVTPTEVQMRMLGRSLLWFAKDYPGVGADGTTIGFLAAETNYTFQVRLIRRVNGAVTHVSAARQVTFTTPAVILPFPVPDGDDTNVEVGEPPDFDPDTCDLEVELQENDGTGWVTVDTFTGSELTDNGDGTWSLTTPIPNSFFNEGSMYRFRSREDCGAGPGPWFTGTPFDPPDDWADPCTTPPALSNPPFTDPSLLVYVPQICAPDIIREAVSGIAGVHGDALLEILALATDPNQRALLAISDPEWSDTPGGILAYGECPQVVGETGDKSIAIRVKLPEAEAVVLGEVGAMRLTCVPTSGGWRAAVIVYKTGSTITLPTATELDLDTVYWIGASHDLETGDIKIYVDDVEDNDVGGADNVPTINALPIWRVGAPPDGWVTDFAFWNEVIVFGTTPTEVTVTINQASGQADPANGGPVLFDVVFSESVSGFATGDVTLSGTAGGTLVGTVTGSGNTYTVTVTGMTSSGTVIADIAAAVCTGDVSGLPNEASTSTDNTVTWNLVGLADYTIQIESGGNYVNNDTSMLVVSGDFLLISNMYRGSGAAAAPAPTVDGTGVALSGTTSIYASANFDTFGSSRGSARVDRATAASTGTMISASGTDIGQVIMRWAGISGAPDQTARSTLDATDSCNVSLPGAPSGTVIVIVQFGPAGNGANLQPAAPSGWTKLLDHSFSTKGVCVFMADTPQQTFTWSLTAGTTVNGGRDVVILEF